MFWFSQLVLRISHPDVCSGVSSRFGLITRSLRWKCSCQRLSVHYTTVRQGYDDETMNIKHYTSLLNENIFTFKHILNDRRLVLGYLSGKICGWEKFATAISLISILNNDLRQKLRPHFFPLWKNTYASSITIYICYLRKSYFGRPNIVVYFMHLSSLMSAVIDP